MSIWEAILLGIIQGLTEFLPVSSSGHIELGKSLLGVSMEGDLSFTIAVHGATVLSTVAALWGDLKRLVVGVLRLKWNEELEYAVKICVSMVPVGIVGFAFHDRLEALFGGSLVVVGVLLLVTAALLGLSSVMRRGPKEEVSEGGSPSWWSALLMGVGQAFAVLPGLSRSGTTIAVGLLSGTKRAVAARFSFLMVIPPIVGMNLLEMLKSDSGMGSVGAGALMAGFLSAFVSGYIACRWMLSLVRRGRLVWFAAYCAIVGVVAVILAW